MKRKVLIAVAVIGLLAALAGCQSKKPADFQVGHLNSTAHLLAFVAKEEGFFEEEGLNVTLALFSASAELVAGLESGKLAVSLIGSVPVITNQAAGHDITVFGGAMSNGHGYVLKTKFIPADFKQGDISVLKGRNIASVKNTPQDFELMFLLRANNFEIGEGPNKVNVIYFESQKDAFNALASEQIDGVSVYSPYASVATNLGHTVVYYCNEVKAFENQPCCRQVALTSALKENPDKYIAFERAIIKAYKFSQENRQRTVEHVAKYIAIDKKDIDYEIYGGLALSHPDPDKKGMTELKKGVVEFGYTKESDYDIDKYYNLDIYKKALEQVLAKNPNDSIYKSLAEHFKSAN